MFPSLQVPDRPSLTPGRCTIDRRHKWSIHFLFFAIDSLWSLVVVLNAIPTDGEKYVLSYGQVCSIHVVYRRMYIEDPTILPSFCPYSL